MTTNEMWRNLSRSMTEALETLGEVKDIEIKKSIMTITLSSCRVYFLYQPRDQYIDTVVGHSIEQRNMSNSVPLTAHLELYLTGQLNSFKNNFKKGPEYAILPSGWKQHFGYVARLIESDFIKKVVESDFSMILDYYDWMREESNEIRKKIKEVSEVIGT